MLLTTEVARCFSTKTPSSLTSKSSPFTSTIPGANCLIKRWKVTRDGFAFTCLLSSASSQLSENIYSSDLTYLQYLRQKTWYWEKAHTHDSCCDAWRTCGPGLRVISMELRGVAAIETTSVPSTKPLLTAPCQRRQAPHPVGTSSVPGCGADVCGFLKPPESDRYWKVRLHGAFFHSS